MPSTPPKCSGVILAGGLGSRLQGVNKARLTIGGRSILDRILTVFKPLFDEIVLVTCTPEDYLDVNALVISDHFVVRSSLNGIYSGLFAARHGWSFICACDTPFIQTALVQALLLRLDTRSDVILPETAKGIEPLFCAYHKNCLRPIRRQIETGRFKIQRFFDKVRVKRVSEATLTRFDPHLYSFININTPEDLQRVATLDQHARLLRPTRQPH